MFSKVEWLIAKRYLKTRRKESFITMISWLSLIGITIGVAVLIIVISVMNGFKRDLIKSIVGIEGHITVAPATTRFISDYRLIANTIARYEGVSSVGATINTQALISSDGYNAGAMVKGLSLEDIRSRKIELQGLTKASAGQYRSGAKEVLVGKGLAENLGLAVGSSVKLVFPEFSTTVAGSVPKYITAKVAGFFKTGMFQYDNNMVVISLRLAQKIFNTQGVQNLEVFIDDPEHAAELRGELGFKLPVNLYLHTWQENNMTFIGALNTERNVMFIILVLIILVATFNIMSGLVMLVRSKTKEIAVLKTLGLSSLNIQKIFLIIGLRTGIIGTAGGCLLGVVISLNLEPLRQLIQTIFHVSLFDQDVYFLAKLPSEVNLTEVVLIAGISLLLSVLVSIYPARRAAKITIARALYYE